MSVVDRADGGRLCRRTPASMCAPRSHVVVDALVWLSRPIPPSPCEAHVTHKPRAAVAIAEHELPAGATNVWCASWCLRARACGTRAGGRSSLTCMKDWMGQDGGASLAHRARPADTSHTAASNRKTTEVGCTIVTRRHRACNCFRQSAHRHVGGARHSQTPRDSVGLASVMQVTPKIEIAHAKLPLLQPPAP